MDKTVYVSQRKLCAKLCNDKRSVYYKDLIASKKGDQRALYKIVNNLFDKNKSSCTLPEHEDPKVLANSFNDFYINKVNQLRSNIPVPNQISYPNISTSFQGTVLYAFRPVSEAELRDILKSSGIKTSFHDKLPAKLLKQVIDELIPHLCTLVM